MTQSKFVQGLKVASPVHSAIAQNRARRPRREAAFLADSQQYAPAMLVNDNNPGDFPARKPSGPKHSNVYSTIWNQHLYDLMLRYGKKRHSSSSEVARGALRRNHNMGADMKPRNIFLTGRQKVVYIYRRVGKQYDH